MVLSKIFIEESQLRYLCKFHRRKKYYKLFNVDMNFVRKCLLYCSYRKKEINITCNILTSVFAFPNRQFFEIAESLLTLRYQRYSIRNIVHSTVSGGCEI